MRVWLCLSLLLFTGCCQVSAQVILWDNAIRELVPEVKGQNIQTTRPKQIETLKQKLPFVKGKERVDFLNLVSYAYRRKK